MDKQTMQGFCGIDCGACSNYKKNANCAGCRDEREMLSDCPTRVCVAERGHSHCGGCGGFPCKELQDFYESGPEMRARARENIMRMGHGRLSPPEQDEGENA